MERATASTGGLDTKVRDWLHRAKEETMKKATRRRTQRKPEMLDEYDFSKGTRGRYAKRYRAGSNVVVLSPDVAEVFPDSESVNQALRALVKIARQHLLTPPDR